MRNIKLTIEYDGADYAGWQSQKSKTKTIQHTIEETLQKILQEKIKLIASGRTDAGVHAQAQVANFKTRSQIPLGKLQRALNGLLPDDISIYKIDEVGLNFHSRFNAKSKIYRYTILNRKFPSALLRRRVYFCPYPLDIKLMRQEARCLWGRHNFKAFCASGANTKTTVRTIKKINIQGHPPNLISIDIEADGFLYSMVRNIIGTLMDIGRGKLPKGSLKKVLLAKDRKLAGQTAPACGLCLLEIKY